MNVLKGAKLVLIYRKKLIVPNQTKSICIPLDKDNLQYYQFSTINRAMEWLKDWQTTHFEDILQKTSNNPPCTFQTLTGFP